MPDVIMYPIEQILYPADIISASGYAVKIEMEARFSKQ